MWIGLLVLFAHLVDIVEWLLLLVAPRNFSTHAITNSPWLIACVLAGCMALLAICRVRSVAAYLIAAAAVLSHIILDYRSVRLFGADLYGWSGEEGFPTLREMFVAEVWLFGLILSLATLYRVAREPGVSRPSRKLAAVFAVVALLAAISRWAPAWIVAYFLAFLHSGLLARKKIRVALLWNLVPLVPLLALVVTEAEAMRIEARGMKFFAVRDYGAASRLFEQALGVPTRSSKLSAHVYLSTCLFFMNDLEGSEQRLLEVIDDPENPYWPRLMLAYFYVAPKTRGTPFNRPGKARQLLESIAGDPHAGKTGNIARAQMDRMISEGIIPTSSP